MAVYTPVGEADLEAFLAGYDLGEPRRLEGIKEGVENSNFRLETSRGRFILTVYEKRVEPADLPFFLGLMEHLAAAGVPCPRPVRDREGRALRRLLGKPAAVVGFLEGRWPRRVTVERCEALGRALAGLHLAGRGFGLRRANALSPPGWRRLAERCAARADEIAPGLAAEVAAELDGLAARWPGAGDDAPGLPRGVIHADLFPDNVLFEGDRVTGVIDFYFACDDLLAYDLAVCLNAWCFEADLSFNVTKGKALLDGYGEVRALSPDEVEALPLLARGAALRFLLTRLHDWLHRVEGALVRPKDPVEYLRKLRFHRAVAGEGAAAYGL